MPIRPSIYQRCLATVAIGLTTASVADAHFPWLATNDKGHAIMWFGESSADRTYHMPGPVSQIELFAGGPSADNNSADNNLAEQPDSPIPTAAVDTDELVGIESKTPISRQSEIAGAVTYGLYHGTKLTYHVEHLPHEDSSMWPTEPRSDAEIQTVIVASEEGGVRVDVFLQGQPASAVEVKLFGEDGDQNAARETDASGSVVFTAQEVKPGLNAVMASRTDPQASGELDGEAYGSTTDYLTSTFFLGHADSTGKTEKATKPKVDPNSGASVEGTEHPELPEELTSFGAAFVGNRLYVYGGHTGQAHSYSVDEQSDRLWCLDLDAKNQDRNAWQALAGGPRLQGLALVSDGLHLIRVGGFTAMNEVGEDHELQSQATVAKYDPASDAWTEMPSLPEPRSSLDAAVLDGKLYVFGGWQLTGDSDDSLWHSTGWKLDLADQSAQWMPTAQPPFKRRAISVAAFDGRLYVIGGMTSQARPTTRVDVYDPATDTWTKGPAIPGSGMSGFGNAAFAAGGKLIVSTLDGFVHQLEADQQGWTTITKVAPARFFHRMIPVTSDRLLLVGGANMEIGKFTDVDAIVLAGDR